MLEVLEGVSSVLESNCMCAVEREGHAASVAGGRRYVLCAGGRGQRAVCAVDAGSHAQCAALYAAGV